MKREGHRRTRDRATYARDELETLRVLAAIHGEDLTRLTSRAPSRVSASAGGSRRDRAPG